MQRNFSRNVRWTVAEKNFGYTLVQHSGYGYAGKYEFEFGLETRHLSRLADRNMVERVGGCVYADYLEAEDAAFNLMYGDVKGMIPKFKGTFSEKCIDGLRIAIPRRVVVP